MTRAQFVAADFVDRVESVGGTVQIDRHDYATWQAPKVTITVGTKTTTVIRPTYRQCFAVLTDWLTDNVRD